MQIIDSVERKKQRNKWKDSSPHAGYNRNQLKDEEYHLTLAYHNPLWRYVTQRFTNEAACPVTVLGYDSIPLAIELSQWTYPVTYITDTHEGVEKAKKDCEIQAGSFKDFYYFDFGKNCPASRIVLFIGLLQEIPDDEIIEFLEMLLRRCREVVCGVPNIKDWYHLLSGKFNFDMEYYHKNEFVKLVIKEHE